MTLPALTAGSTTDTWSGLLATGTSQQGRPAPSVHDSTRSDWDLVPGFLVVLGHGAVASRSLETIVDELKSSFLTNRGAAAAAYRVGTLWNSTTADIQVDIGPAWRPSPRQVATETAASLADGNDVEPEPTSVDPAHSKLAHDLRTLTGLPASTLGPAAGVTREQYQRWLRGDAISDAKHGQLIYLHTIARDASRRLGGGHEAKVWWRTPNLSGDTPAALLKRRRLDLVYALVANLFDVAPVRDGVRQGLLTRDESYLETDDFDEDGEAAAWSPYGDPGR